jgi:hypothetical protein
MKTLIEYKKHGRTFKLLNRIGNIGMFQAEHENGRFDCEIIQIQSHQGRECFGKTFPPAEYPPSTNQWGTLGWTAISPADAARIFREKTTTRNA